MRMKRVKKIAQRLRAISRLFTPGSDTGQRKILFETLEKRVLLSADPVLAAQDLQEPKDLLPEAAATVLAADAQAAQAEELGADSPAQKADSAAEDPEAAQTADSTVPPAGDPATAEPGGEFQETTASRSAGEGQLPESNTGTAAAETPDGADPAVEGPAASALGNTDSPAPSPAAAPLAPQLLESAGPQLVFIDSSVPDYESLLDRLAGPSSAGEPESPNDLAGIDPAQPPPAAGVVNETQDSDVPGEPALNGASSTGEIPARPSDSASAADEADVEIIVLDADRDGFEQISETLARYQGVSAVHILSHGAAGTLRLGNTLIDKERLDQCASQLKSWQNALQADGDVLLYGCNVAAGEVGVEFVESLSRLTGTDVAASTDDTGGSQRNGDWVLEYSSGVVETAPLFSAGIVDGYGYLLGDILGTGGADTLTGNAGQDDTLTGGAGDDTYVFQDGWGSDTVVEKAGEGVDTLDFSAVTTDLTFSISGNGHIQVSDGDHTLDAGENIEKIIGGSGNNTFTCVAVQNLAVPGLRVDFADDSITRSQGSWTEDGFAVGMAISITATSEGATANEGTYEIAGISDDGLTLTLVEDTLAVEDSVAGITIEASGDMRFAYLADGSVSVSGGNSGALSQISGMNAFVGGAGVDTFDFSALTDDLRFDIHADGSATVQGSAGPLVDLLHFDSFVGGSGDDTFVFEDKAFVQGTIDGGGGRNALDYSAYTSPVNIDLTLGEATATARIARIQNVIGGAGDDTFVGNDQANAFTGGGGRDTYRLGSDWLDDTFSETETDEGWDTLDFSGLTGGFGFTVDDAGRITVDDGTTVLTALENFELIVGSAGDDTFRFLDNWGNVGVIENAGNGTDTLDFSAVTDNFQFTIDRASFAMGSLTLDFGTGHITRSMGSWADEGFAVGQTITVSTDNAGATANAGDYRIAAISADGRTLILEENDLTVETGVEGLAVVSGAAALGSLQLSFTADTITRSMGSWTEEGFRVGHAITIEDSAEGVTANEGDYKIAAISGDGRTLTLVQNTLAAESGVGGVAVKAWVAGAFVVETGEEDDQFSRLEFVDNIEHLIGGSGADTFYFKAGAALPGTIDGGGGSNTLNYSEVTQDITVDLSTGTAFGTAGISNISNIYGGMGADTLTGNADANVILGGDEADVLRGLAGNDLLSGGEGDDILEGGAGDDEIVGGAGTDRVSYENDAAGVTVNLAQFTATDGFVLGSVDGEDIYGTDSLNEIEDIEGSGFDDNLAGDTYENRILGGAGDDTLTGGAGNDVLDGGAGSDTVNYAFENTGVTADLSTGTATDGTGNLDTLTGIENLVGSQHDDILTGDAGGNVLSGLTGNDTLSGGEGDDTYRFGDDWGDDTLSDDTGANTLDFSDAAADLNFTVHQDGSLSVDDTDGVWRQLTFIPDAALALISDASTLDEVFTFSHLVGGSGDNAFIFEDTAVFSGTIDGGTGGTNTLDYSEYEADVTVNLQTGEATGTTGVSNVHTVVSGKGALQMVGHIAEDAVEETVSFVNSAVGVVKDLGAMTGIENITGSANDDTLTGDGWLNILDGRGGDDVLIGGDGIDIYKFQDDWGTDTIVELADQGMDTLDFSAVTAALTFTIHSDGTVSATDGTNYLHRVANVENIIDGQGDDTFIFEDGAVLAGTIGLSAADFTALLGFESESGANTLDLSAYTTDVTVDLGMEIPVISYTLPGYVTSGGTAIVGGLAGIVNVIGGSGDDTLMGTAEDNVLMGGAGNDVIYGRDGVDILEGGAGDDTPQRQCRNRGYWRDSRLGRRSAKGNDRCFPGHLGRRGRQRRRLFYGSFCRRCGRGLLCRRRKRRPCGPGRRRRPGHPRRRAGHPCQYPQPDRFRL